MKNLNSILLVALLALFSVSCADLNLNPESEIVTESQKDPSMIASDVNALNATLIYCGSDISGHHADFGYPAVCITYDVNGADMAIPISGYNHFRNSSNFTARVNSSFHTELIWNTYYKYITTANSVISAVPEIADNDNSTQAKDLRLYLGTAYAARAFAYLNLAQTFQFNYVGNEDKPCVPIVTEETTDEEQANNPRKSVREVYTLVLDDLEAAIDLLSDASKRPNKGYISLGVAYGIRARAHLAMGLYAEAADDAGDAITAARNEGINFLTREDVEVPGFNDAGVKSCMWAALVSLTSRCVTTGIINWPSMLCSFDAGGYTGVGAFRTLNAPMYNLIQSGDVRKGWWVNEKGKSPLSNNIMYKGKPIGEALNFTPYTNVKFHAYNNEPGSQNASDWIMMRLEEMVLIQAEGLAMSGNLVGGKQVLSNWVSQYRQPGYSSTASSPEEFQDEVWFQRRIELWGEGFSWFDIMRLKKNVVRVANNDRDNTSWLSTMQFNVAANDPIMLWRIPQDEITANAGISESDNNENTPVPQEGDGLSLRDGVVW